MFGTRDQITESLEVSVSALHKKGTYGPHSGTSDYSCTLYKDSLVLYGGKDEGTPADVVGRASIYNLKEKRLEDSRVGDCGMTYPRFSHAACVYEKEDLMIFCGGMTLEERWLFKPGHSFEVDKAESSYFLRIKKDDRGCSF